MDCVFCKIVKGEIPCNKIYEDKKHLAFLDISDDQEGHTLVITKKHIENLNTATEKEFSDLMKVAKKVADHYISLGYTGTSMAIVGLDVKHIHIHIIPRKGNKNAISIEADGKKRNLKKLAEKLRLQ